MKTLKLALEAKKLILSIFVVPFVCGTASADEPCAPRYDKADPIVSAFDKLAGGGLVPNSGVQCGDKVRFGAQDCDGKPASIKFNFGKNPDNTIIVNMSGKLLPAELRQQALDAIEGQHMKADNKTIPMFEMMIASIMKQGSNLNATLCLHADKSPFIRLVGTGSLVGHNYTLDLNRQADGSIQMVKRSEPAAPAMSEAHR
jgi:hypothetical protein